MEETSSDEKKQRRRSLERRHTVASSTPVREIVKNWPQSAYLKNNEEQKKEEGVRKGEEEDTRVMKDVPPPVWNYLTIQDLVTDDNRIQWKVLKEHLFHEGRLELDAALLIVQKAKEILSQEKNVLELKPPLILVGDIHGQYYDLIHLLENSGSPEDTNYLFLGDYVDRGRFSTEVCFYLFSLKICFPNTFFLLRGNHEARLVTERYNFKLECCSKYNLDLYNAIMEAFDALPLAACLETKMGTFLCVHGGLSPNIQTIQDIKDLNRFVEIPNEGPMCDLLWSDPLDTWTAEGLKPEEMDEWYNIGFEPNPDRGCSYVFGYVAVEKFLKENNLISIIRAHEVQKEGFLYHDFLKEGRKHPYVITVFSAANYCDMYRNQGAYLKMEEDKYSIVQFPWVEHPFVLPTFENAISYSLPTVIDSIEKFCKFIFSDVKHEEEESSEDESISQKREENIKKNRLSKIRAREIELLRQTTRLDDQFIHKVTSFEEALQLDREIDRLRPGASHVYLRKRSHTFH